MAGKLGKLKQRKQLQISRAKLCFYIQHFSMLIVLLHFQYITLLYLFKMLSKQHGRGQKQFSFNTPNLTQLYPLSHLEGKK